MCRGRTGWRHPEDAASSLIGYKWDADFRQELSAITGSAGCTLLRICEACAKKAHFGTG